MNNSEHKTADTPRKAYIIGFSTLNNELLSYAIQKECNAETVIIESIEELERKETEDKKNRLSYNKLILIDSKVFSFEEVLRYLSTQGENQHNFYKPVLFNLQRSSGVELKALARYIKGFFYDHDSLDLFLKGIKAVFNGEIWVSRNILLECAMAGIEQKRNIIKEKTDLTEREIEILNMVSMGTSNDEIAEKIDISPNTVKTHIYNIFKKINVTNRLQAALWAAKNL